MKYILLIFIMTYTNNDIDVYHVEFNSELNCEIAKTSAMITLNKMSSGSKIEATCVPKGVE